MIKHKTITLLYYFDDYMVVTVKNIKNTYYKKYDYETINKFKYTLLTLRVVTIHNAIH
jgi:hypothetical protein